MWEVSEQEVLRLQLALLRCTMHTLACCALDTPCLGHCSVCSQSFPGQSAAASGESLHTHMASRSPPYSPLWVLQQLYVRHLLLWPRYSSGSERVHYSVFAALLTCVARRPGSIDCSSLLQQQYAAMHNLGTAFSTSAPASARGLGQWWREAQDGVVSSTAAAAAKSQQWWQQALSSASTSATAAADMPRQWLHRAHVAVVGSAAATQQQPWLQQASVAAATVKSTVYTWPIWLHLQKLQHVGRSQLQQQSGRTPDGAAEGEPSSALPDLQKLQRVADAQASIASQLQQLLQQHQAQLAAHDQEEAEAMRKTLHEFEARVHRLQAHKDAAALTAEAGAAEAPSAAAAGGGQEQQQQQLREHDDDESEAAGIMSVLDHLLKVNQQALAAAGSESQEDMYAMLLHRFQQDMLRWKAASAAAALAPTAGAGAADWGADTGAADAADFAAHQQALLQETDWLPYAPGQKVPSQEEVPAGAQGNQLAAAAAGAARGEDTLLQPGQVASVEGAAGQQAAATSTGLLQDAGSDGLPTWPLGARDSTLQALLGHLPPPVDSEVSTYDVLVHDYDDYVDLNLLTDAVTAPAAFAAAGGEEVHEGLQGGLDTAGAAVAEDQQLQQQQPRPVEDSDEQQYEPLVHSYYDYYSDLHPPAPQQQQPRAYSDLYADMHPPHVEQLTAEQQIGVGDDVEQSLLMFPGKQEDGGAQDDARPVSDLISPGSASTRAAAAVGSSSPDADAALQQLLAAMEANTDAADVDAGLAVKPGAADQAEGTAASHAEPLPPAAGAQATMPTSDSEPAEPAAAGSSSGSTRRWFVVSIPAAAAAAAGLCLAGFAGLFLLLMSARTRAAAALGPPTPATQRRGDLSDFDFSDGGDDGAWGDQAVGSYHHQHGGAVDAEIQPYGGPGGAFAFGGHGLDNDEDDDASFDLNGLSDDGEDDSQFSYDVSEEPLELDGAEQEDEDEDGIAQQGNSFAGFAPFTAVGAAAAGLPAAAAAGSLAGAGQCDLRPRAAQEREGATEFWWLRPNKFLPRRPHAGSDGGVGGGGAAGSITQRWLRNRVVTSIEGSAAQNPEVVGLVNSSAAVAYSSPPQQRQRLSGGGFLPSPEQQQQQQQYYERRPLSSGGKGEQRGQWDAGAGHSPSRTPGNRVVPGLSLASLPTATTLGGGRGRSSGLRGRSGGGGPSDGGAGPPPKSPRGLRDDRVDVVLRD